MRNTTQHTPLSSSPWWRYGMVWMVIAGPAVVVVAGLVTAWIAIDGADTLVSSDYYRRGIEINKTLLPAVQGRNHAATPVPSGPPASR